jgi:hypothetical protein
LPHIKLENTVCPTYLKGFIFLTKYVLRYIYKAVIHAFRLIFKLPASSHTCNLCFCIWLSFNCYVFCLIFVPIIEVNEELQQLNSDMFLIIHDSKAFSCGGWFVTVLRLAWLKSEGWFLIMLSHGSSKRQNKPILLF